MIPRRYKTYNLTLKDLQVEPNWVFYNLGTTKEAGIRTLIGTRQKFHIDTQWLAERGYKRVFDTIQERTGPEVKGGMWRKWSKFVN
jgi:hypothetical protein